jgi:uncharacterized protein
MADDLHGKVCVITGASSGIGRRTALDLAESGVRICAAARREDRLRSLVEEMGGAQAGHTYFVTDVSKRAEVKALAAHVRDTYGRLDILINNAGFAGREGFSGPDSIDEVERVFATNFFGAVYCTGEMFDLLESSAPSQVINIASMAGRIATPGASTYAASKFALVGWTEGLGPELAKSGIYLSSVEPGFVPTEGFPQHGLLNDKVMRYILGTDAQVSAAIRDAIEHRKPQRVVPRWYYMFQIPKVVTPGIYRFVLGKVMESRAGRAASDFR